MKFNLLRIPTYSSKQVYVPLSIISTLFWIFKDSLLQVPFNLKNGVLKIYKKGTYYIETESRRRRFLSTKNSKFLLLFTGLFDKYFDMKLHELLRVCCNGE